MHFRRLITVFALVAFGPALTCGQIPAASADQATAVANRYCVTCHNNKLKTGGLTLERLDVRNPTKGGDAALETWEKAIRKVRVGMMPPQGAPKPTEQERATLVAWLESELDRARKPQPAPGQRRRPSHESRRIRQRDPRSPRPEDRRRLPAAARTTPRLDSTTSPRRWAPRPRW